jgi:hypothetical protein
LDSHWQNCNFLFIIVVRISRLKSSLFNLKTFEQVNAMSFASSGLFIELVSGPPRLLGLIHGDIGIFQEAIPICSIIGIDSDADTRCHNELMGVDEEGLAKTVNDLLYNLDCIFNCLQVGKDQHKLVTTEARNGIPLPECCA